MAKRNNTDPGKVPNEQVRRRLRTRNDPARTRKSHARSGLTAVWNKIDALGISEKDIGAAVRWARRARA